MTTAADVKMSETIRTTLQQVLTGELRSEAIDVNIEAGSKIGDNYMGVVYRVNARLSKSDDDENEGEKSSINVILKVAPTGKARRDAFATHEIFLREIVMYDEVLPMFRQFQESNGIIPETDGFHEVPKCYKTLSNDIEETLIFEDLRENQFEMFDRFEQIGIDHVRLIMVALGKYHALSFALRDQQPEQLKRISKLEENLLRKVDANTELYFKQILESTYKAFDRPGDERLLAKLKDFFNPGHVAIIRECCNGALAEPYSVICHGDCWNNNVLFKHDAEGKPFDLRLLDWQLARYASPVTDLVYYIFNCTTKPLRDQYYDDMIKTYHDSLSEMITRLGSDAAKLFPFEVLQIHLRQFGKFGLAMSTLMLPIVTLKSDKCPDLDELMESYEKGATVENSPFHSDVSAYSGRLRDVIIDMERLGYF